MTPTDLIAVTLNAQAWDTITRILADAPYRVSAPFIVEIQNQCIKQQQRFSLAPSETAAE
jgi:16S rRNA A1518/A1519 N6-dimethyltransferase RsmA/KsgA/DIM1 with predicted DNA glycosylase/AP lyase activity